MELRVDKLQTHLQHGKLAPLYLVSGDEPLQTSEIIDALRIKARELGYVERIILDVNKSFDWNRLQREAATLSLFSSKKIIELRLGNGNLGHEGRAALIEHAGMIVKDNLLIISCAKLDKRTRQTKWYKSLEQAGVVIQIWPIDTRQLPNWIQQRFSSLGKKIDLHSAEIIAQKIEGNLLAASQEINKLCLLVKNDVISFEEVAASVTDSTRFDVFAMMEAAFQGDLSRTSRMLSGLRGEGVEPMRIYAAIMWNIRQLADISNRIKAGTPAKQVLSSQWGLSPKRKHALQQALLRKTPDFIQQLLITTGKIDEIIKGDNKSLGWSCFHELMASLTSTNHVETELINALTSRT